MPNDPYLDASVVWRIKSGTIDLHEAGYRSTQEAILSSGMATKVEGLISAGKEADVYLATYNGAPIAIKVYRLYRTSHRGGGPIKLDSTGWLAAREYEMTRQAWKGGARVPAPARRVENMLSMRYLGDERGPAPRLQDVDLEEPKEFLEDVLEGIEVLARAGVVHTDMSAFNILVHGRRALVHRPLGGAPGGPDRGRSVATARGSVRRFGARIERAAGLLPQVRRRDRREAVRLPSGGIPRQVRCDEMTINESNHRALSKNNP